MRFVRAVWKLLVGIKDALVLVAMLLFFGAAVGRAPGRADADRRGRAAGRSRRIAGRAAVAANRPPSLVGAGSLTREHRLRDVVAAVDAAATDDRVKAIALDLESFVGGGQSAIATLGEALDRARRDGQAGAGLCHRL